MTKDERWCSTCHGNGSFTAPYDGNCPEPHGKERLRSLQGERPTGDYKQAEATASKDSRSESPAPILPSSKVVMTPQETAQFVADCQTLIAHSRTFYELRDALAKAVAFIQSNAQPIETDEKRDRYCPDCGITHCFPVEPTEAITLCAAPGPSGFICERPKGHPGRHCDGDNRSWLPEKATGCFDPECAAKGFPHQHK